MRISMTIAALLAARILSSAETPAITVSANGSAKTTPTGLLVWVTIKDKGADAGAASDALKAAKEKVAAKLAAFGVKPDEIKSDVPAVIDKTAQQGVRSPRSGGRLKRKPATEEKPEVEMQQVLRAVIPLTAKERDAIFIEAESLKSKIKLAKLVEEKADAAEGDEDENAGRYYDGNPRQEAVMFAFFAPHTEELRSQALADALKKANESAARAAKVAGKGEIALHSLSVGTEADVSSDYQYRYNPYGRNIETPTVDNGIVSQTPELSVHAHVSAEFRFK